MSKIESVLRFENYIVKEVNFKKNPEEKAKKEWKIDFNINSQVTCNDEKNKMHVELSVNVFEGEKNAPFYISATIVGFFELIGKDDITKYKANAIAIMYPYLRAIISTYTAVSNVTSLTLPAINVNAMLEEQEEKNK